MNLNTSNLTRAAGIAAALSGLLYITIQLIHPAEEVSSVTTTSWVVVHYLTLTMAVLGLVGATGIYLRQVRETGLLGLAGFLLFGVFYLTTAAFNFVEALVLPAIAQDAPQIVDDILGIFGGAPADGSLGTLELVGPFGFGVYLLGGLIFGIAVFRARVLSRWAGILLAGGALSTLLIPLVPHEAARFAAVPVGLAMAWLGYSLWADGRRPAAEAPADDEVVRLDRSAAE